MLLTCRATAEKRPGDRAGPDGERGNIGRDAAPVGQSVPTPSTGGWAADPGLNNASKGDSDTGIENDSRVDIDGMWIVTAERITTTEWMIQPGGR